MNWDQKKRYRAAVETVACGLAGSTTPTERAESEHAAALTRITPWNGPGISERSRPAHAYCDGGCSVSGDPEHPHHLTHAHGCGTHSGRRCGGRAWASRYRAGLVVKTDWTDRVARKGWTR